jgi:hypothetical protein
VSPRGARTSARPRVTFDVSPDELAAIERAARERELTVRQLCLSAIHQALEPTFRFSAPRPPEREPLEDFLREAREVVMVGRALTSLQRDDVRQFLRELITGSQAPMTFMTIDPEIDEADPVYQVLNRRYAFGGDSLKDQLQTTYQALGELSALGRRSAVPVRVLGIKELPMCGVVIRDPFSPRCRMRISLYLAFYRSEFHPFFEIDTQTNQGRIAGDAVLRHYERLSQAARLIDDFPG